MSDDCLGHELNRLRSRDHWQHLALEAPHAIIGRLRRANPGSPPPLFVVDLDGLDEVPESSKANVRRVINLFWDPGRLGRADSAPPVDLQGDGQV